jgi:hypothetical protein
VLSHLRMLLRLARILSEPVMGFLALAALVFGMVPELFDISLAQRNFLAAGEWLIVFLFAVEYGVHFMLAGSKRAYVQDPWRILDLVIIAAPLISLIPGAPEVFRSAPFLRVLRLVRAILAGTRASKRLLSDSAVLQRRMPGGPPVVTRLDPDSQQAATLRWEDLLAWLEAPHGWLHAGNLEKARLDELARATRVPRGLFEAALGEASFPRLEPGVKWTALSLPLPRDNGERESILLLITPQAVLSLSLFRSELQGAARPLPGTPQSWSLRVVFGVLRLVLSRHEELASLTERELRALEELPADESPGDFFERVFAMRKRISTSKADLWRLRGMLRNVAAGRRGLPGGEGAEREESERIAEEADALHETAEGLRESLLSLLDLHLNVSGYGMNRFMRLLAIVSALALIPAVVGGLMGMNLIDNPWPATLPQVGFGTFILMLCVLYTFMAKGWLK